MDFGLDETQLAVAELAAEVLGKEAGDPAAVDVAAGAELQQPVWAAMAQSGLLSLPVPVAAGGEGLGVGEVAVLLTEVGRRAAAVPALATLALGVLALARFDPHSELLPRVAAGELLLTGAPSEPAAPLSRVPKTRATRAGAGWTLTGTKAAVPYAEQAARVLVPAAVPDGPVAVFLVDPHGDGVTLSRTPTASGGPEYTVRLDGAAAEPLGSLDPAAAPALREFALVAAAAVADGALAGALQLTTEHVRTRRQFGKPLATFQAVAQQVADVYVGSRTMHLAAASAAWRLARGLDAAEDLELAAYWLAAEALPALRVCHHLHGGVGVDVSYPLHRHYSLVKDLSRFVGGAAPRLEGVAACTSS